MNEKKTFTFVFTGKHADEVASRFSGYFWDGGLDQYLEQEFLEQFGLDCDNFKQVDSNTVEVETENAQV